MNYVYVGGIILAVVGLAVAGYFLWMYFSYRNVSSVFGCTAVAKLTTMDQVKAYEAQFNSSLKWTLTPGTSGANQLTATDPSGKVVLETMLFDIGLKNIICYVLN